MNAPVDSAADLSRELEGLTSGERIQLLVDHFPGELVATTSFGAQAAIMLHLLKTHAPEVPIVFIDTGYLFPETYQFAEQLIKKWDLNLRVYQPLLSSARLEALYGKLWEQGDAGAAKYGVITKVEPMNRAMKEIGAKVWLSGLRRDQSKSRGDRAMAEQQKATLKVYPIIDWNSDDVSRYLEENAIPPHPLVAQGYVSIGDWHSTKQLEPGMTAEQTRFDGAKRECGLHLPSDNQDYQI